jgi:hypothetical protein
MAVHCKSLNLERRRDPSEAAEEQSGASVPAAQPPKLMPTAIARTRTLSGARSVGHAQYRASRQNVGECGKSERTEQHLGVRAEPPDLSAGWFGSQCPVCGHAGLVDRGFPEKESGEIPAADAIAAVSSGWPRRDS